MKLSALFTYIMLCIESNIRFCLVGDPGIGKTSIIRQVCIAKGYRLLEIHVSEWEAVDLKGFPVIENGIPRFVPYGEMQLLLAESDEKIVVLFDDLGHGKEDVLKNVMQIIRGGLGVNKIPDNVFICAATNDTKDKAGVKGLIEPLKSSMVLVNVEHSADDSMTYALANNWDGGLCKILEYNPDFWHKPNPTLKLEKSPCPREWERVNSHISMFTNALNSETISRAQFIEMEFDSVKGCVGHEAAIMYVGQVEEIRKLPNPLEFLSEPKSEQMPDQYTAQSALYILTSTVANLFANVNNQTDILRHNMWTIVSWLPDVFKRLAITILDDVDPVFKSMAQRQDYRVLMAQDINII